ncbi:MULTISPECIES: Trm112 family protein [unclassified Gilliamella]|uniref:Trm112 family protein n=1 Tax=unclassified Gilliamella TaxID=2685620 RepID=UPI001325C021|nr:MULTISPECIES: Trm112 family protein [unclassified Gilliamella]MWN32425.1 Trm112 family protein [Gilliamella sp. Pra-s60]MWP29812.1 Trm112 family protein [Gilliamella sp. Pra-s54]MWP46377.1 Trm112 family protein [Gilliamella sp. Pas-s27]
MKEILLSALACPKCHGQLQYDASNQQLICSADNLVYTVKDNIPVLLECEAKPLNKPVSIPE